LFIRLGAAIDVVSAKLVLDTVESLPVRNIAV
jgi:hypothetical protein